MKLSRFSMLSLSVLTALLLFSLLTLTVTASSNSTSGKCGGSTGCTPSKDGLILPVWRPLETSTFNVIGRGIVYFFALCYLFLGVSIISDRFMSAIEVITSQEKTVKAVINGKEATIQVQIWNETVSNLTLMALGSSAPEILLSVIEICGTGFTAGELGPGTIVGSAAFNLFCIIAICVYVIPDGEVRRIEHLRVFICTSSFSVLAYIWLYLIISIITPKRVDIWEALLTFAFFPLLVGLAYVVDRRIFFMRFLDKKYSAKKMPDSIHTYDNGERIEMKEQKIGNVLLANQPEHAGEVKRPSVELEEFNHVEALKREFMRRLHELREKHPNFDEEKLEQLAAYEMVQSQHKSRAYYRIAATRKMTGGGNVLKKTLEKRLHEKQVFKVEVEEGFPKVIFDPLTYTVMENVGSFEITVVRQGTSSDPNVNFFTCVDFITVDGTANTGSDFHHAEGTLTFFPGETSKDITLHIVDDDIFEEDEHFSVQLSNIRNFKNKNDLIPDRTIDCRLPEETSEAVIIILDDDHCGVFGFAGEELSCSEDCRVVKVKVNRASGARGHIYLPYMTKEGTAKGGGVDYMDVYGELEFRNDETFSTISIPIINHDEYEKSEYFFLELGHPKQVKKILPSGQILFEEDFPRDETLLSKDEQIALQGRPKLGPIPCCQITINESAKMKSAVEEAVKHGKIGELLGTSSWKEQFLEAITVSPGDDDDDDENGEEKVEKMPSKMDYIMHFLTLFWKILFAFIPPTSIFKGWACFVMSIIWIGILTAVIGDLASHFGCTVGLKDAVTAISFVALGTSVPDTFASKTAACGDSNADASIGNVTGSNAVNVFLGIGIAWSLAAIYHAIKGTDGGFAVDPGTLGFTVTVFCILACITIGSLFTRRSLSALGNAELGGPKIPKTVTAIIFVSLWFLYVILSALVSYCVIEGF